MQKKKKDYRDYIQKGERDFINSVVKAIIKKDISKKHYLLDDKGIMRYKSFVIDDKSSNMEFKYEDGTPVKVVCIFGEELIKDFHIKAGNDDLAIPWAKRAVKSVIGHGKKVAKTVYK
ncbi:hypothetical protein [Oceanobacillus damuensis]|uniref:hypothetical protein n=1 Tax=Oceanobacillus damuensis TaxID=937928 RepID=UPI0008331211|nr:hypothetical protein [Oceanobacillus damuensis]